MMEVRANLFLVGAMKAGTTAFIDMIGQHSCIYVSPIKEPHFFVDSLPKKIYEPSRFFDLQNYMDKVFPKPLHIAKLNSKETYSKLFSEAKPQHAYLAEASTGYLHAPEAAKRIHEYNPDAKIIILLREPLARAFSHYTMDVGLGRTLNTFQEELQANFEAYNSGTLSNWSYLGMSLYFESVKRFIDIFGRKQIHIIELKSFSDHPENSLNMLFSFLSLPEEPVALISKNIGKELSLPRLFFLLKKLGLKDYFSYLVPKKVRQQLFNKLSSEKKAEMLLDEILMKQTVLLLNRDQQKLKTIL